MWLPVNLSVIMPRNLTLSTFLSFRLPIFTTHSNQVIKAQKLKGSLIGVGGEPSPLVSKAAGSKACLLM